MPTTIPFDEIEVSDRQRQEIKKEQLKELKQSIHENGLLHPIVVMAHQRTSPCYKLIAGGRRLQALKELFAEHGSTTQVGDTLKTPCARATILKLMDVADRLVLEYEENAIRVDLDWKEQAAAIAAIHEARTAENPKQTQQDTARELQKAGGEKLKESTVRKEVTQALAVVNQMHRPEIQKASSAREAYSMILKDERNRFEAELAQRSLRKAKSSERLWDLKQGDLRNVLVEMEDGTVDLILTDPPYGLGQSKDKTDSARNFHRYEDTESYALELSIFIIQEGWRLTKPTANLFMFCTWKTFPTLFQAGQQYGWTPWYHPIIWRKSGEGEAPWGRFGFVKTYEILMWMTKGKKGINGPIPDVLDFQKLGTKGRDHAAEKPQALLTKLIEVASIPNDLVLDPCAGSGSTLEAAIRLSRRAKGCELNQDYFNGAMARLAQVEEERNASNNPRTSGPLAGDGL